MGGPRKRSTKAKADEAQRVAAGEAAMKLEDPIDRSARVRELVALESEAFLHRRWVKIQGLQLTDLNLNFILLRLVRQIHALNTPRDVVRYLTQATLRAGEETAYGWLVDLFLPPIFGAHTPPEREDEHMWQSFKEIDKEITRPNPATGEVKRHFVSLKAGPLTINDTMAREMHANVEQFVKLRDESIIYGVTYGRPDQLSNKPGIVKGDFGDEKVAILVGRELWEWLGQYEGAHEDIFHGIAMGEAKFEGDHAGTPIGALLEARIDELAAAFAEEYSIGPDDNMWQKLLETGF